MIDKKLDSIDIDMSTVEGRRRVYSAIHTDSVSEVNAADKKRLDNYKENGFTKEAFKDTDWLIRLEAYEALGFTADALTDEHWLIRESAAEHLNVLIEDEQEYTMPKNQNSVVGNTRSSHNLIGRQYFKLKVHSFSEVGNGWSCICICGNPVVVKEIDLMSGKHRSCGCGGGPVKNKCTMKKNGLFIA